MYTNMQYTGSLTVRSIYYRPEEVTQILIELSVVIIITVVKLISLHFSN